MDGTVLSRRAVLAALAEAGASALAGCRSRGPSITVDGPVFRDAVTPVELSGFPGATEVTLTAHWDGREQYASTVVVETDEDGTADLSERAPVAGTYEGVDPMGWLWSMEPRSEVPDSIDDVVETARASTATDGNGPGEVGPRATTVTMAATVDEERRATTTQIRRNVGEDVEYRPVRRTDLRGELFLPGDEAPHPGVIALHGSGGDPWTSLARALATKGFAAFALDWFGSADGTPSSPWGVPLSYFHRAAAHLRSRPAVRDGDLGLTGGSYGGEAALVVAANADWVGGVVALAPSSYRWRGKWERDGELLPSLQPAMSATRTADDGVTILSPAYREAIERASDAELAAAAIPVERIDAPLLLVSGGDDELWPSATFARHAVRRLSERAADPEYRHLSYPDAGHLVSRVPYVPTTGFRTYRGYSLGGTPAADAAAMADAWPERLAFHRRTLGAGG